MALDVADKGGARGYDPVTVADQSAESVISAAIARTYPDHGIRGEEHGWQKGRSNFTWVIDPIDGTRSFILGQMHWATLIALNDGERPVVGVAHQPYVGESFAGDCRRRRGVAARQRAADAHDASLPVRRRRRRRVHGPQDVRDRRGARGVRSRRRPRASHPLGRRLLCVLPAGDGTDRHRDRGVLQAYDVQALIPIVEAAGGVMTTWTGERCDEGGYVLACGDRDLHPHILRLLAEPPG